MKRRRCRRRVAGTAGTVHAAVRRRVRRVRLVEVEMRRTTMRMRRRRVDVVLGDCRAMQILRRDTGGRRGWTGHHRLEQVTWRGGAL